MVNFVYKEDRVGYRELRSNDNRMPQVDNMPETLFEQNTCVDLLMNRLRAVARATDTDLGVVDLRHVKL